jgi:type I restriction-modification system DNA methylase subunit
MMQTGASMASQDSNNNDLAYADTLWKSADALRGQVDAAEYKHVVLGLLFLKYISDAFAARREGLMAELVEPLFRLKAETDFESRKLAEMRDYLRPRLLSGELRVNDAATTAEGLP